MKDPALLYLIYNKELNSAKIGVSDITGKRYASHRLNGWRLIKYWYFENSKDAYDVESKVLKLLRESHKLDIHLTKDQMPQNGYTETFDASKLTSRKVTNIVNKIIKHQ